ncbi:hypothetical protein EYF80_041958 [Liparis tanakae]|uniref:Uncharacterized protein n=1 Tax=Liparis tanakae TaxID=230148 RepID=A0A4Z2G429_9TELE|nr:hypothetical protein EYF80_041958 [Liparis tanakae]
MLADLRPAATDMTATVFNISKSRKKRKLGNRNLMSEPFCEAPKHIINHQLTLMAVEIQGRNREILV